MRVSIAVILSWLLLASCMDDAPVSSSAGEMPTETRVSFSCVNGERLEMRFFPLQGIAVLMRNGDRLELQQQVSASGFIYSNGPTTVRGKGDEISVEIGRMMPIICHAAPAS